uniref:Uncharacterized protein n=1 Tax=Mogami virus TaxID=2170597 RepID=A0A2S0S4P5_9VIRU|nr:hypothetical protein [Mogami virus]
MSLLRQEGRHHLRMTSYSSIIYLLIIPYQTILALTNPITYKDYGVILTPENPVYVPEDYWQHVVKIKLPCLTTYVTEENLSSLKDMSTIITETLTTIRQAITEFSPELANLDHQFMLVSGLIKTTTLRFKRTQNVVVRAWGLLPVQDCKANPELTRDESDTDPNWQLQSWAQPTTISNSIPRNRRQVRIDHAEINELIGTKLMTPNITDHSLFFRPQSSSGRVPQPSQYGVDRSFTKSRYSQQRHQYNHAQDPYDRSDVKDHEVFVSTTPTPPTSSSPVYQSDHNSRESKFASESLPQVSSDRSMVRNYLTSKFANAGLLGDQPKDGQDVNTINSSEPISGVMRENPYTRFDTMLSMLVSSEWSSREITICDSDTYRQTKICRTEWAIPDVRYARSSRQRRGLCNWCGDSIKWLYGLASVEDVQDTLKAVKADIGSTVEKINDLTTAQSAVIDSVSKGYASLELALDKLVTQAQELKAENKAAMDEVDAEAKKLKLVELTSYATSAIATAGAYIQVINHKLDGIEAWFRSLKNSIQNQLVDVEILNGGTMDQLIAKIESSLPADRTIVPSWLKLQYLDAHSVSVFATKSDLVIIYRIPLILKSKDLKAYQITSLPFQIGNASMSDNGYYLASTLSIPWRYVLADMTNQLWVGFTKVEWNECESRGDKTCLEAYEWRLLKPTECLPSLVLPHLGAKERGQMCSVVTERLQAGVTSSVITPMLWMVSVIGPKNQLWIECKKKTDQSATEITTQDIHGLNLIRVEPGCRTSIGNLRLTGRYTYKSESFGESINGVELMTIEGFPKVTLEELKSFLSIDSVKNLNRTTKMFDDTTSLLTNAQSTVSELRKKLESIDKLKTIEPIYTQMDKQSTKLADDMKFWSFEFIPLWFKVGAGVGGTLLTLIVMYKLMTLCKSPTHMALAAIPPLTQEMRTFAASIAPETSTIKPAHDTSEDILAILSKVHNNYYHVVSIGLGIIMLCLMVYCIWMQHGHVLPVMKKMLYFQGIFPFNTTLAHHPGESPITMTILCEFISLFGKVARFEIGVQAATLPSPGKQWRCKLGSDGQKALIASTSYRFLNNLNFRINWQDVCIQSNIIEIESCSAMPPTIKLPMSEVIMQVLGNEPWLWYKINPLIITKIFVGQGHQKRVLYSYVKSYQESI